ncbi:type ISP restriction/modification enzyme [Lysinibacillus capsici]|uniref:DEAD/DEAH box helicase n=1 Tax=Lysinibacillus capsici TaxID=2115968 RepID=UPI002730D360|nr:type ISP restriction/modification enzyme [Lysinibacillus capsici]MDP1394437.1 type ISP restriction/modification enzyme [Lysinibacillus capsici]MDP1414892.1 type ISP restriction/modification enzyme [Lysinibacillus capsici]MDP1430787.1 type ISP restriction/modification enzyme [Lysinibacillus capsici]
MSEESKSTKNFISLVKEMDTNYRTQRDRGTMFETLSRTYFKNEPMYERLFDEVWMLNEVPEEYGIPKSDTGVDLVAKERETGLLVAIQCKYYSEDTKIQKQHIDSFLNEVGKEFYSKGIIITSTDKWGKNAEEALNGRDKKITRISLTQLKDSKIDWSEFTFAKPEQVIVQQKKTPRQHQIPAIEAVVKGFETVDRGKLIMAPGTGKTYTSMAIAEELAKKKDSVFRVLYLVPSIQLLSQTLRGWTADTNYHMDAIAVCSDRKVTKQETKGEYEDITVADIGFPATTSTEKLLEYQSRIESSSSKGDFLAVFSTYQSIDVIIEAQKQGFYEFDLVVCDEAHRTTGATELGKEDSSFTKVHYDENIKTAKRLYQTATPRVYGDKAMQKADELSVVLAHMDRFDLYGEEFYRIGFGDAIRQGILTDYKVMVLAVDEEMIARRFQQMLANKDSELEFDDVTKIIGCWNGLVRRCSNSDEALGAAMKRAIAFTGTIRESKLITEMFTHVVDQYLYQGTEEYEHQYEIEIDHADGSMNALEKNKKISWLKDEVPDNTCRILSNARFLTEGVDVPDLDAIMFLKPRKSKIDIAQAVGRVMRKSPGKDYGYVILPIGVPAGADENSVLNNNDKYRVVWEVLNALRSLDERFDATINKLELNKKKPDQIQIIGVGEAPEGGELTQQTEQLSMMLTEEDLSDLERAIFGKIVRKVGNVRYWEDWSKDVAEIAKKHMLRIQVMLEDTNSEVYKEFQKFIKSLRYNINDSISETQAIEMLAQHLITKPVFEALFDSYSFVHNNPVSKSMDTILSIMDEQGLMKEQEKLESFYESVRVRAEGIDNLKAKQDIIIQLYDKFFKVGFKETTERLGIVFTPVEVVDFIIHSVDDVLKKHFGKSLATEGVHVLDPFTGTGTFVTRLLQSGLIPKEDLLRKYTQEIHANEIVLLSYYIAAINMEETFHSLYGGEYVPFEGIVLTDTFESTEHKNSFIDELFNENNARIKRQQEEPIFAIIGNPPYSGRQRSENDDNENTSYPKLDKSVELNYVKTSKATAVHSVYDSYIKALRWASDRLGGKGVIGFITGNSFIDKTSTDGVRHSLYKEFNHIYIVNLKGALRAKSGDDLKREGQNVFDIMTGVTIVILVKDGSETHNIYYSDIGDNLSRISKLNILNENKSVINFSHELIIPDEKNDWINKTDKNYDKYISLSEGDKSVFYNKQLGVNTKRDKWVYNFNKQDLINNVKYMLESYNNDVERTINILDKNDKLKNITLDESKISWSDELKRSLVNGDKIQFNEKNIVVSQYRPFTKKYLYFDKSLVARPGKFKNIFSDYNEIILTPGKSSRRSFSTYITNNIPDLNIMDAGAQGVYLFENNNDQLLDLKYNLSENICKEFGLETKEMFYYVYALMHSKEYRNKFKNNLNKDLPRIPKCRNKDLYVKIGKELVDLHLNYEIVEPYPNLIIDKKDNPSFTVSKMKFKKKGDLTCIIFNNDVVIRNIPVEAYDYIINGRSAIEWIMDQYQIKVDKKSGLVEDPNNYSDDPKYVYNLLLSVINVSMQTLKLIDSLPRIEINE